MLMAITVDNLACTDVKEVDIDLAGQPGSGVGDGSADTVTVTARAVATIISVANSGTSIVVRRCRSHQRLACHQQSRRQQPHGFRCVPAPAAVRRCSNLPPFVTRQVFAALCAALSPLVTDAAAAPPWRRLPPCHWA